jgi:hypothetical protein
VNTCRWTKEWKSSNSCLSQPRVPVSCCQTGDPFLDVARRGLWQGLTTATRRGDHNILPEVAVNNIRLIPPRSSVPEFKPSS